VPKSHAGCAADADASAAKDAYDAAKAATVEPAVHLPP
jgi:hypothetical protein